MYTLIKATTDFIRHCKYEKNLSSKTIKAYQIDIRQLTEFLCREGYSGNVNRISKVELRHYLEVISLLKPKSIKRKIATIKALFNYLEFEDLVELNPLRKMRIRIKEAKVLPKAMNIQEIFSIFKAAYQPKKTIETRTKYQCFETLRNIVVLELLFATGARVSEIANLCDDLVDLNSGEVTIKGKGGKERIVQVCDPDTLKILRKYRKHHLSKITSSGGFFLINRFNRKLSDQSIRNLVKNVSNKAKITKHITPHMFRHTVATLLLEKDVDIKYIQAILGHSSIMTTQIYTQVNSQKQKEILSTKHPRKDFSTQPSLIG